MPKKTEIKARNACAEITGMNRSIEKSDSQGLVPIEMIENRIYFIRGQKVMIGQHLAELYGVQTGALIQAVKRNIDRFPDDFMFQLDREEIRRISQIVISLKYSKAVYAFSEQGIAMLSSVLNSKHAIQVNIAIMRAFVKIRQLLTFNKEILQKLSEHEHKIGHHDQDIISLFSAINKILKDESKPKGKIGFI